MTNRYLKRQRTAVFVDLDNIQITNGERIRIDWPRFFDQLEDYHIVHALGYKPDRFLSPNAKRFYERAGLEICPTASNSDPHFLADSVRVASRVDRIIFVSGDGCTIPFITLLESSGVQVEVWAWPNATSEKLIEAARKFVPLDNELIQPSAHTNGKGRHF